MSQRLPVRRWIAAACFMLASAACAPHGGGAATPPPVTEPGAPATVPVQSPAPTAAITPSSPDASCQVASDCAVKNVGNCCGYFPACVNKDAAVDPAAVRAECERSGTASVCGFRDIQACDCVQNRCQAVDGPIAVDR